MKRYTMISLQIDESRKGRGLRVHVRPFCCLGTKLCSIVCARLEIVESRDGLPEDEV
jgi:hypothetical protein